ncbi:hypothetical protein AL518_07315 [Hafnia paralvei]|jgi:hypothetical protein|nr:hypothetical protein AL518_07315 [Hafnia paralvei]EPC06691.1 hypothetical protein HMPREF0864_04699 [Enterobacteriaceae bacterium 9_2_54FAA]
MDYCRNDSVSTYRSQIFYGINELLLVSIFITTEFTTTEIKRLHQQNLDPPFYLRYRSLSQSL